MYEKAQEMLEDPTLGVPVPDYSDDPELSGRSDLTAMTDSSLTIPYQRILSWPRDFGFPEAYKRDYAGKGLSGGILI